MKLTAWLAALAAIGLGACAVTPPPQVATVAEARAPVTILVSIDGFRPDYLDRGVTPVLSRLAAEGVSAAMRPSFPSKTFPNNWTLVTGLRPDRHGIVSNAMEDPEGRRPKFTMATHDPWWWDAATPLWVDAERAGIRTAAMFWPGSEVAIGGVRQDAWPNDVEGGTRPDDWIPFGQSVDGMQRVDTVIDWIRRPAATRPRFVTLYFDTIDTEGHRYGPGDPRTTAAIADVDKTIGHLVDGLAELRQPANLVIVSDHGMAEVSKDRVIPLAELAAPTDGRAVETGVFATFQPLPGRESALAASLSRPHPHVQCWRKEAMPARFAYGTNPRIPPWFCLAETGWRITDRVPDRATGGEHGYDNADPAMRALFLAHGPAFAAGRRLGDFDNVDVAPLLRRLIGLPPKLGLDGDAGVFEDVLRR